jgi:ribosomal protein S12 methylthiotransferase accessory factor
VRRQPLTRASVDWVPELCQQLEQDGFALQSGEAAPLAIYVARETPLTVRVSEALTQLGIDVATGPDCRTLALIDHSGLDPHASQRVLREIHRAGYRSMSIWTGGDETLYGPLAIPRQTACWSCARDRFSDSLSTDNPPSSLGDSPATVRVVVENLALAVRYPHLTAYGCVLVENGEAPSALHSIVPMPSCEVCGGAATIEASLSTVLARSPVIPDELRVLADPRGGVLRQVVIFDAEACAADAPVLPVCSSASIAPIHNQRRSLPASRGEGKAASQQGAVWSAIGEGIERYSASWWRPSTLTRAPFNAVKDQAFDPHRLVLYDDDQYAHPDFPFAPFDPDQPMDWTLGRWLDTGERVLLPALATYMHFPVRAPEQFGQITSNGLAVGTTFEDAALRAVYELIERDAFMLAWLARRPAVRIAEDGCHPVTRQALHEVRRLGARTELYLLDAGTHVPTVVCFGFGDGDSWPGVTVGLGTHASIDVAVQRAVLEHGHCGTYIRRLMREGRHLDVLCETDVVQGLDHALYYIRPERRDALEAFRGTTDAPALLSDLRSLYRQDATLAACAAQLRDAGIRAAAVDVTSPDVALAPLRVVRAFGTDLQPIHFGHSNRRLSNPRLRRLLVEPPEIRPHPIA